MKSSYLIALLISIFVAGTYWYQSSASVCPVPLAYRLGSIDGSFELSSEDALAYFAEAEALWENAVDRDLFVYDESAEFTIDFIFDERQESANSEAAQREMLDAQRDENEKILKNVESLQAEYQSLSSAYKARVARYEQDLSAYNTKVNKYNDRGGAPPDVFKELEDERKDLNQEADALSVLVKNLNDLASEINELSEKGNELVTEYNQEVDQYNTEFGFSREFTQGDYQGNHIHIYKFSSDSELVTVLAHEFGHALGIDHVDGSSSLMYYLLEETEAAPTLTSNDLTAYYTICGASETTSQKIRRIIREFLAKF